MTHSLGVWAMGSTTFEGTLYRWEADQGVHGAGYVVFDVPTQTIRPADVAGTAQGDLCIDARTGVLSGVAKGVDPTQFVKVAAAIFKAYARNGDVPQTAHAYYG